MQASTSVRREIDLVASCVRTFLSASELPSLQSLNWPAIEHAASRHSVTPLVAYVLKQHGDDLVRPEVLEQLDQRLRSTAQRNLIWLDEWQRVLNAFGSAGIRAISLKGPAFALLTYGNIALRESTDLDLLIRPEDMSKACEAVTGLGYQLRFQALDDAALLRSRNCQFDFINPGRGTLIDLHWSALHKMFPFQLLVEMLFASAQTAQIEDIFFLSLSPEHMLLYLCAHGTKHCWQQMRWLCDVACHVRTSPHLDWELCIRQAEAANCTLVLKHSLLLAEQVVGLELPIAAKGYCDNTKARMLATAASSFLFSKDDSLRRGKALRYHLAFAVGWRDRMRFMFERIFAPEDQDWQEVRLPHSLRFVYYTIRPMRFMLERIAGATFGSRVEDARSGSD